MRSMVMALALMAVSGAAQAQEACTPPTEAEMALVRDAIDLTVPDGPSTRYRDLCKSTHRLRADKPVVCGLMNTKNRMGAYTGFQPFYVLEGSKEPRLQNESFQSSVEARFDYCAACMPEANCRPYAVANEVDRVSAVIRDCGARARAARERIEQGRPLPTDARLLGLCGVSDP